MVVPSLLNKTALASELKLSCKEGEAFDEITNISAGIEGAYDKMWEALCLQYDNITLAVSSALDEIQYSRHVRKITLVLSNLLDKSIQCISNCLL